MSQPDSSNQTTVGNARRQRIKQLTALSLLAPGGFAALVQEALAKGDTPPIMGINSLRGSVTVNGQEAKVGTPIKVGDKIATGAGSRAVVVVGKDAWLLRENTTITLQAPADNPGILDTVLVASGKLLSVFEKRQSSSLKMRAQNATIGIRGTGAYIEIHENKVYFCLCYGEAGISGKGLETPKLVKTTHHESPLWLSDSSGIMTAEKAPMMNHWDNELEMLEGLTGRKTPFADADLFGGRRY